MVICAFELAISCAVVPPRLKVSPFTVRVPDTVASRMVKALRVIYLVAGVNDLPPPWV
jgi:hypothetical protein